MHHGAAALPGQETLVASWSALTQLSPGARLIRAAGTVAAVFPQWAPLNNAIILTGTPATAVAAVGMVYGEAGVSSWALWLPSPTTDFDAPDEVREITGLERDTTTLVMQATLPRGLRANDAVVRTSIAAATRASGEAPVPVVELPPADEISGLAGWVIVHEGAAVSGAWSFRLGTDCGIYTVGTLPRWQRRGLARTLVEHMLADARRRGAQTATLQSTREGQPLYAGLGFDPVGRYEEWISR